MHFYHIQGGQTFKSHIIGYLHLCYSVHCIGISMYLSLPLPLCLSVSLSVFLYLSIYLCVSVHPCLSLCLFVSVCLSVFLSVSLCLCISISISISLCLCPSVSLSLPPSHLPFFFVSLCILLLKHILISQVAAGLFNAMVRTHLLLIMNKASTEYEDSMQTYRKAAKLFQGKVSWERSLPQEDGAGEKKNCVILRI